MSGITSALGSIADVIPGGQIIGAGLGAASSLLGQNSANSAANAASQNQSQFSNLLLGNEQTATNAYNNQYGQLTAPLVNQVQQLGQTSASNTNNLAQLLQQAGVNPSVLSNITGINANQLSQNYTGYESNTGGTNLAQATPGAQSFYQQEANNGINSQFASNAQNQIQQGLQQQISDATAQAKPGQNINAMTKDLNNQALAQSANLAGNLAGQSQTFSNSAEQSLLGAASGLDTQTSNMLGNASTTGQAVNQQQLGNLGTSYTTGTGILNMMQQLLGQGQNLLTGTYSPSSSGYSTAGSQAQAAGQAAAASQTNVNNAFGTLGSSLAGIFGGGSNGTSGNTLQPIYNTDGSVEL